MFMNNDLVVMEVKARIGSDREGPRVYNSV